MRWWERRKVAVGRGRAAEKQRIEVNGEGKMASEDREWDEETRKEHELDERGKSKECHGISNTK